MCPLLFVGCSEMLQFHAVAAALVPGWDFDSNSGEKACVNVCLCVHGDSDAIRQRQVTFCCIYRNPQGPQIGCESPRFACKHSPVRAVSWPRRQVQSTCFAFKPCVCYGKYCFTSLILCNTLCIPGLFQLLPHFIS